MKAISFFYTMAFCLMAGMAFAQPQGGWNRSPEEMANAQTERMKTDLALDEAQTEQVSALNLKYAQKQAAAREEAAGDREAMRATMGSLREEKNKELKAILTAEQYQKWETIQAERGNSRGGPPSGNGEAPAKPKKEKKNKAGGSR